MESRPSVQPRLRQERRKRLLETSVVPVYNLRGEAVDPYSVGVGRQEYPLEAAVGHIAPKVLEQFCQKFQQCFLFVSGANGGPAYLPVVARAPGCKQGYLG